ncbi:hypothetical protein HK102_006427, partial [Quaeritorhiza haematococci]
NNNNNGNSGAAGVPPNNPIPAATDAPVDNSRSFRNDLQPPVGGGNNPSVGGRPGAGAGNDITFPNVGNGQLGPNDGSQGGLGREAWAGILTGGVVGCVAVLAAVGLVVKKYRERTRSHTDSPTLHFNNESTLTRDLANDSGWDPPKPRDTFASSIPSLVPATAYNNNYYNNGGNSPNVSRTNTLASNVSSNRPKSQNGNGGNLSRGNTLASTVSGKSKKSRNSGTSGGGSGYGNRQQEQQQSQLQEIHVEQGYQNQQDQQSLRHNQLDAEQIPDSPIRTRPTTATSIELPPVRPLSPITSIEIEEALFSINPYAKQRQAHPSLFSTTGSLSRKVRNVMRETTIGDEELEGDMHGSPPVSPVSMKNHHQIPPPIVTRKRQSMNASAKVQDKESAPILPSSFPIMPPSSPSTATPSESIRYQSGVSTLDGIPEFDDSQSEEKFNSMQFNPMSPPVVLRKTSDSERYWKKMAMKHASLMTDYDPRMSMTASIVSGSPPSASASLMVVDTAKLQPPPPPYAYDDNISKTAFDRSSFVSSVDLDSNGNRMSTISALERELLSPLAPGSGSASPSPGNIPYAGQGASSILTALNHVGKHALPTPSNVNTHRLSSVAPSSFESPTTPTSNLHRTGSNHTQSSTTSSKSKSSKTPNIRNQVPRSTASESESISDASFATAPEPQSAHTERTEHTEYLSPTSASNASNSLNRSMYRYSYDDGEDEEELSVDYSLELQMDGGVYDPRVSAVTTGTVDSEFGWDAVQKLAPAVRTNGGLRPESGSGSESEMSFSSQSTTRVVGK